MRIKGFTLAQNIASSIWAFNRSRRLSRRLDTRDKINSYQDSQIQKFIRSPVQSIVFYQGVAISSYQDLPIIDKQILMENFHRFNAPRLTAEAVRHAISHGEQKLGGYQVGQSTGTSGNRGFFVISDRERFIWLGTILAKTLPKALWKRHKVALALPGMTDLYKSATSGSRVDIRFYDLSLGVDAWEHDLEKFAPDTIVAPPKVLRYLSEQDRLTATNIFSAAEVLDPLDQAIIESATGQTLRQIYMATEGLFGVSCPYGTLHLAEDVVKFEWVSPSPESSLVSPLITDFTRKTQIMARYKMNDLLELSQEPCPCGSAFQAVAKVEGRSDDIFHFQDVDQNPKMVTPDILRNTLIDIDPSISDFRIVQTGPASIEIAINPDSATSIERKIKTAFAQLLNNREISNVAIKVQRGFQTPFDRKLRRVRCEWKKQA